MLETVNLEFTRPYLYPKQFAAIYDQHRLSLIEASTKAGKTSGAITWILEKALGGATGQNFWWVAPVSDQAKIAFRRSMLALPQDLYTANLSDKYLVLINGAMVWFKSGDKPNCYDDKTEILTRRGWKLFRDIIYQDKVMTRSASGVAQWQEPTRIISAPYAGEMVTITNKRMDLCVTPNHRMLIERRSSVRNETWSTAESLHKRDTIPSWSEWEGVDDQYLTEDKCALLGLYLAEGSALGNMSDESNRSRLIKRCGYRINFAQTPGKKGGNKGDVRAEFEKVLTRLGYQWRGHPTGIRLWDRKLWEELIPLGNKYTKFIPGVVKNLPRAKLRNLLFWMVMGDGSSRRADDWVYFTASRKLADDVQEISIKCGWNATISEREQLSWRSRKPGATLYLVKIQKKGRSHHLCNSKISYIGKRSYAGSVHCVSVPNRTVLVRRNGKPAWCGNSLYGEDVFGVVIDEASRMKEDAYIAIRSTVTFTRAPIRIVGNVRGRKNWFFKLARRAEHGDPEMGYHKIVAADAVAAGVLDAKEIDDARSQMPEQSWRELYLAEPSDDGGNPFGLQHIQSCIVPALSQGAPVVWGWDLAKRQDYTVGIGLDSVGYVCRFERFQGIPWDAIMQKIVEATGRTPALVDSTGVGDPIVDMLQKKPGTRFEGYHFTQSSKQKLMEGLAVAIQSRGITFPDGVIVQELEQFEFEYTRIGVRYGAPEGYNDDSVCALALAVMHKSTAALPMRITQDVISQIMRAGAGRRR